jgi:iron complex outermembrane recepter protein
MSSSCPPRLKLHIVAAACAGICMAGGLARADEGAPAAPTAPAAESRIVVTGSHIRRIDAEAALPMLVITADDIEKSGRSTVTELLQGLAINGPGGVTDSQSFGNFAYGASGISLRGLGPTATLVLINGRRVAPYSVPDINKGLTNFVNVDAIPRSAIARIEVLKDGASAIYGSDAIAGVVNIILRSDYEGGDVALSASANQQGQFATQWGSLTVGKGSLARDGWNWMASLEAYHRDQVMLGEVKDQVVDARHRDSPYYFTGRPNTNVYSPYPNYYSALFIDPALGVSYVDIRSGRASPRCPEGAQWAFNDQFSPPTALCGYDAWNEAVQYVSPIDRQSGFVRAEMRLDSGIDLYGEMALTNLSNRRRDWPVPFGAGLGATPNGRDGGVSYVPQYLPVGHPNNPFPDQPAGITYSFRDVGMQGTDVQNTASRVLLGARGMWNDWDWDIGLMNARDQARVTYRNRISLPALRDAVENGTYDFENPGAGAVTAKDLRVEPVDHGVSQYTSLDAKITGTLADLAAGPLSFASGVELRHESRRYTPDERTYAGGVYLLTAGRSEGSRSVASAFGELDVPVMKNLESQLALRVDSYSDYGSSVTPKLAVAWKALDVLKLRGSMAKGFRAPSLNESSDTDMPLFNYIGFDPKRCGAFNIDCDGYNNSGVAKANAGLKPETSTSYAAGFVLQPTKELGIAVDYWRFDRRNEIEVLSQQAVIDNEDSTDPLYAGRIHRLPDDNTSIPGQTIPGRIATVETQYVNRGRTQVSGVDLDLRSRFRPEGLGVVQLRTAFTYLDKNRFKSTDSGPWLERAGSLNVPRVRGSLTVDWTPGAFNLGSTANYVSGFRAYGAGRECVGGDYLDTCMVSENLTFDLFGSYDVTKAFVLRGTVRNIADKRMPFTPTMPLGNTYWYAPEGRYFTVSANYKF